MEEKVLFWFRRDLRLNDNAGLYHALRSGKKVQAVFIFDREILDHLPADDRRVVFIHRAVGKLKGELQKRGSELRVFYGKPADIWAQLIEIETFAGVYTNYDFESYAKARDRHLQQQLEKKGKTFHSFKDHVIADRTDGIFTASGSPYTVFTPYKRKWLSVMNDFHFKSYPTEKYFQNLLPFSEEKPLISLAEMGFNDLPTAIFPDESPADLLLEKYASDRDFPSRNGTSKLGVHLRFGTVSIREIARRAKEKSEVFLSELIWRDFYAMILDAFPHAECSAFKPAYDAIPWVNDEKLFKRWCEGTTGYPLVDAGMRELNETGFMHNRVRMVTASFLTKHLLTDWRWGESYFAEKLLDFDLASNNGGWQWAAGSGCDAAPYFRIFNPSEQFKKFDSEGSYVRKWVPEYESFGYPAPIVEHTFARNRALETYKKALSAQPIPEKD